ncbi:MAG: DUF4350 domain-containing protein [Verrucomicrobiales bacterium]|nr:DUF4350 domain-containing protein [Verrucomicrobiales bacterium]
MSRLPLVLLSVLVLGTFTLLMARLFEWRFGVGDMYPPYSTLRSDPLGAKALHDSLQDLPNLEVERHVQSAKRLPSGASATLFLLGLPLADLRTDAQEVLALEKFVQSGGRLVLALHAGDFEPSSQLGASSAIPAGGPGSAQPPTTGMRGEAGLLDLRSRWQFEARAAAAADNTNSLRLSLVATGVVANASFRPVAWRSRGQLVSTHADWTPVLALGTNTVALERPLGLGTVVVCADSYLFSNEGLRSSPASDFLAWLIGSARHVVFDEAHLGVLEAPGTASLARRYRLELPFFTLGALAALLVWRGASSFEPRREESGEAQASIRGRSMSGGFVGLLRRNIAPGELLALCLKEWRHSRFGGRSVPSARLVRVQEIIDRENLAVGARPDPVRVYQEISAVLSDSRPALKPTPPQSLSSNDH